MVYVKVNDVIKYIDGNKYLVLFVSDRYVIAKGLTGDVKGEEFAILKTTMKQWELLGIHKDKNTLTHNQICEVKEDTPEHIKKDLDFKVCIFVTYFNPKVVELDGITYDCLVRTSENGGVWFNTEWLQPVTKKKTKKQESKPVECDKSNDIPQKDTLITIYLKDDNKIACDFMGVKTSEAKCHKNDYFNLEKGTLLALGRVFDNKTLIDYAIHPDSYNALYNLMKKDDNK